jgi:hypothetical protein
MGYYDAAMAVRDRVVADGLTVAQIAELHAALPARGSRSEDESAVSFGLSLAHGVLRRAEWADTLTPVLVSIADATTDAHGNYVDGGDGFASKDSDAIDSILSARYADADAWAEWEAHPTFVPMDNPECGARFKAFQSAFWMRLDREDIMRRAESEASDLHALFISGEISARELQRRFNAR